MAFVGHAPSDFGGDLARKPCFMGKSFSKSLCHGVDIIGGWWYYSAKSSKDRINQGFLADLVLQENAFG